MRARFNPAVITAVAMVALFAGVWLVGYLAGFSGEPETFLKP
ncbi:hypothetical protein [Symbiobacterium thermophilum]|jgi:uncharacterized membrane protein|uniref:Uncharacterized protein n=1 Tax=Symbiobacterium thermophilum (strain DSM 24528 / JCM 14929 / IAM 14863 / T) TaxID=292459 RepID=Q67K59_SYMTH|nr:hypothetical protein [Symbiobacterium thermophilum]BAD41939.1 hypothetical protein STH2956 [Symbiobacterium thermophilum IAM 14863]